MILFKALALTLIALAVLGLIIAVLIFVIEQWAFWGMVGIVAVFVFIVCYSYVRQECD
jgi:hypothetical protein